MPRISNGEAGLLSSVMLKEQAEESKSELTGWTRHCRYLAHLSLHRRLRLNYYDDL